MSHIGRLSASVFLPAPSAGAAADQLFERAEAYEATQPSYAADLRAAACRARSRHIGVN